MNTYARTTPATALRSSSAFKSTSRVHRVRYRPRAESSLRRSSNIFRPGFSDDEDEDDARMDMDTVEPEPRPRPSYVWDNEDTLVSALLDEHHPTDADPDATFFALAGTLQDNFDRKGKVLLHEMARTLQPTVQRIKRVHESLPAQVDEPYINGVFGFDDACKNFEQEIVEENRALLREYQASKERIVEIFDRLSDAYTHRAKLWTALEATEAKVDAAIATLSEVPAGVERTITSLEKHAKTLAAKDEDGSAADKIRGMLAKLV
uniref:Uncharacterized protein n=1 Tax=Mycena chlorophos TaxID=658473 RepID=A0ABQ0LIZ0_MYCCL|nr:predicted protein [Mycena chlorophos]